jgi:subtilisin family serine protease
MSHFKAFSIFGVLALAACAEPPVTPIPTLTQGRNVSSIVGEEQTYVILGAGEANPADLDALVSASGGSMIASYPEIGVAYARSASASFQSQLAEAGGIESVTPDMLVQWTDPAEASQVVDEDADVGAEVASFGDKETFFSFQWAPTAVQAPEAWNAGYTGKGVRVAILDGGLYRDHVDLKPNVDVAASHSFVPGFNYDQDVGTTWHATHVAGIVAAASTGTGKVTESTGIVGIAPNATLIGVKVLHNGVGSFQQVIDGIMYAAKPLPDGAGAQVINMSLGAIFDDKAKATKDAAKELKKAINRATKYAYQHGVTVIAAAGNAPPPGIVPINFDDAKDLFTAPAQDQHVIAVSATGPHGWALGATDFARPAYYSNFGKSLVDVAAPGGTVGLAVIDGNFRACRLVGTFRTVTATCAVFDEIVSSVRASGATTTAVGWLQGTSQAAPMVAGVAALIIERNSGFMSPAGVRARLQRSALDLGKPGNDEFYGHGWVNAFRAIQ